jgi:hypothetical protein
MNTQNRYCNTENPHLIKKVSLQDVTVGVWCTLSTRRIISPLSFAEKIDPERYVRQML